MADPTRRSTRFSMRSKQIGQLLLENGDVKAEQIAQALKTQEQQGGLLGQILQRMGVCSAQAISAALLKQVQVTDIKCDDLVVAPEVSELVPRELCEAEKLCPFERLGGLLCVVMGNPLNRRAISQIEEQARVKVKSFKSVWPKISELIQRSYAGAGEAAPMEAIPAAEAAEALGQRMTAEAVPADNVGVPPSVAALDAGLPQIMPGDPDVAVQAEPAARQQGFLPTLPGSRRARVVEAPAEPMIEGIDTLNDGHVAEIVETAKKSTRENRPQAPAKPKVVKQAKVNVDLDALDLSHGEMVGAEEVAEVGEALEEIQAAAPVSPQLGKRLRSAGVVGLAAVKDAYFYVGGAAPAGPRPDELVELLGSLPVAQVVAESIGDYEARQKERERPASTRPIELQAAPAAPMTAVLISEADFSKQLANLEEDPVGEWDWQYVNSGPIHVQVYEDS